jgi:hypothetical protein
MLALRGGFLGTRRLLDVDGELGLGSARHLWSVYDVGGARRRNRGQRENEEQTDLV